MNSFRKLLAAACLVALTADLTAQTAWTGNTSNIYLNPLTGKVGIGTSSPTGKLHIVYDHSASGTPYGLYLTVTNNYSGADNTYGMRSASTTGANNTGINYGIVSHATNNNTTSTSATYGVYSNTTSKNKGQTFGYWTNVDNTNTASTQNVYGVRAQAKSASNTAPVYGMLTAVSGGSTLYGFKTNTTNNNATTTTPTFGVQTAVSSQNKGSAFGYDASVDNTNTTSTAGVYGIRTTSKSSSSASTVYGIHATVSGGSKRWAGYFTGGDMYFSGNVGIGTTTPVAKLQVKAEGNPSNHENIANHGFAVRGNDQVLYMGVHSATHVSYIQSVDDGTAVAPLLLNARGGNVGIGTMSPYYKLDVSGIIRAHEIKINTNPGADFVFEEDYALRPLNEVADFIQANKHLPEIPPASDMVANGVDMGELQIKLLQKIEELTLYVIEQDKQLKSQQEEINRLKKNNSF